MDWMYLFYFLLGVLVFFGARYAGVRQWNEEFTGLNQTRALQGITALLIALHHMAQKTCAPWHPRIYTVHGLDVFIPVGYLFVGVFFFCSGLGLYKSLHTKQDYLKGFVRNRIIPMIIAYYLSEWIYTLIRLGMGQKMDLKTILWYLSGLHLANFNAWYLAVIPFFYLVFWLAFRFSKKEGTAIFLVFLFTAAYTVLGAFIDHQDDWWMRGEWWYNSVLLFPMGLLFGRYEKPVTRPLKKAYPFWLLLSLLLCFLLFFQSEWVNGNAWGYYGEWGDRLKVQHRLMSAGLQWMVCLAYTACCFLMLMKVRIGNRALLWLGGRTLSFYLMHGVFVELFGYNFLDIRKSLYYIKNVPLYIAAVLAGSVVATILFQRLWQKAVFLLTGRSCGIKKGPPGQNLREGRDQRGEKEAAEAKPGAGRSLTAARLAGLRGSRAARLVRRLLLPCLAALTLLFFLFPPGFRGNSNVRVMSGMVFQFPDHYAARYSDTRYAVWEYGGKDKRPGNLILDADIRDDKANNYSTVEDVLADKDLLSEVELYVNPQGVRMVRGFVDYSGAPERRYYIESAGAVLLMCVSENEQYYSPEDCEEAILQLADSVRPAA